MKKKLLVFILSICLCISMMPVTAFASEDDSTQHLRILFTSDMHSYMGAAKSMVDGELREHGGSDRLATLLKAYRKSAPDNVIYIDGGDFSQGTLYQAGYEDYACELSMLAELGCTAVCPGNHEWDHAGKGFANMLNSAMKYNEKLPMMLCANIDFENDLNEERTYVKETLEKYSEKSGQDSIAYSIYEVPDTDIKIGFFGVSGITSIEDSPTSGMNWTDAVETAKTVVEEIKDKCDIIICLSHSGMSGSGEEGEDMTLAQEVPDIDFILSGHSHNAFKEPIIVGNTVIGSCGEYLQYLGVADFDIAEDGTFTLDNYELVPVDENVKPDPKFTAILKKYQDEIRECYLSRYGYEYEEKIAHCNFNFMTLDEMYATHQEYPMGDLIADSYIYEAAKNGISDIDVALVGLGTIRGTFEQGDITVSQAFQKCSLGVGADGSAGHPLLSAYITGKELKLLVELDASLGPMVSSIKMSYAGLEYEFNTERMLLDRVTSCHLVREDGSYEEIQDDQMYKVCCNMYAANMLGMLNGLTKGILSIVPKYEDGTAVEDFYTCSLIDNSGKEIKEWVAFADYLSSFDIGESGLPEIPEKYRYEQGRKVKVAEEGKAALENPGPTTIAIIVIPAVLIAVIIWIIWLIATRKKRKAKKIAKKARKDALR